MKKIFAAMAIGSMLILNAGSAFAWGGYGGGWCRGGGPGYGMGYQGGYGHLNFLKEVAGVNDSQIEKIIKIDSDFRLKYYQNRDNYSKLETLRVEHKNAVENVLTADQKKKLDGFYGDRFKNRDGRSYGYCPWYR